MAHAVDIDLSKFFDNVDHDLLMNRLSKWIDDKRVLVLIGKYLRTDVLCINGKIEKRLAVFHRMVWGGLERNHPLPDYV